MLTIGLVLTVSRHHILKPLHLVHTVTLGHTLPSDLHIPLPLLPNLLLTHILLQLHLTTLHLNQAMLFLGITLLPLAHIPIQ